MPVQIKKKKNCANKVYIIHGDSEIVWNMGLWEREREGEKEKALLNGTKVNNVQ